MAYSEIHFNFHFEYFKKVQYFFFRAHLIIKVFHQRTILSLILNYFKEYLITLRVIIYFIRKSQLILCDFFHLGKLFPIFLIKVFPREEHLIDVICIIMKIINVSYLLLCYH